MWASVSRSMRQIARVRSAREEDVVDLGVAVHDPWRNIGQWVQPGGGRKDPPRQRLDGGEARMVGVGGQRLAQVFEVARRVVHPDTGAAEIVPQVAHGAVKACEQRRRLRGPGPAFRGCPG